MTKILEASEILNRVDKLRVEEGENIVKKNQDLEERITNLKNLVDIVSPLYLYESPNKKGLLAKPKNFVLKKFKNLLFNNLETSMLKQQKFNNEVVQILEELKNGK